MNNKKIILGFFLLLVIVSGVFALTVEQGTDLLKEIDEKSNFDNNDFSSTISMISEDPEEGIDKTVVYQFRDDQADKFLILIKEPNIKKGQGYLMVDDNLWFYDPESRKFSHTSMSEQFNNSDANNSDFKASSLLDDYKVTKVEDSVIGKYDTYTLTLEALNNEVTYPVEKLWITQDSHLTLKSEDYSKSEKLMRSSYYLKYSKVEDRYIPTKMIFQDELVEGKKTTMTISDISVSDIPETVFTKSYIERVNN